MTKNAMYQRAFREKQREIRELQTKIALWENFLQLGELIEIQPETRSEVKRRIAKMQREIEEIKSVRRVYL